MASSSALRFAIGSGNALLARQLTDGSLQGLTVELARKNCGVLPAAGAAVTSPRSKKVLLTMLRIINGILLFLAVDPAREKRTALYLALSHD